MGCHTNIVDLTALQAAQEAAVAGGVTIDG